MPRKFDQDAKDRVVRLVEDRILAENMSMQAACQAVAPKLGVSWHTARQWTQQARRAGNIPQPVPEDLAAENARLRRENQELRDTNELLKAASAFFASELDPKRALGLFIRIITVFTGCGKCGMLFAVKELISGVNKLPV
nr:transposase [Corynebacterium striatum]